MKKAVVTAILATGLIVAGTSAGLASADSAPPTNSPKNGNVVDLGHPWKITINTTKWCDGPTLVYQSGSDGYNGNSISVIPNSPECK